MKDVEKTTVERQNSRKRIRRRRRWNNLYVLAVVMLVLTAGITICYTFLFNVKQIRVSGESDMYSAEEIVAASGIKEGDNLLRLDTEKSEQAILDELLYVETASVKRKLPSTLDIKVTKCIPAFNVVYDGGTLLVSKKGKILEDNGNSTAYMTNGLPTISGYEPTEITKGKPIKSDNEHKNEAFQELIASISRKEKIDIVTLDMSDEFNIVVNYSNGMVFKMGSWTDVEYKLNLAETVMKDESIRGKKGFLTMIGSNQCSFRTTDGPVETAKNIEPTKPATTDANGNPIEDIGAESDPDQAENFEKHNRELEEPTTLPDDGNQWGDGSGNYDTPDYNNDYQGDQNWDAQDYGNNNWNDYGGYDNNYGQY